MSHANSLPKEAVESNWQRLSPVAIVYFVASNIIQFVRQFIVVISVLAYSASTADFQQTPYFIPAMVVIFLFTIVGGLLSYWFYQYRIRHQHVEIRSGVLRKRNINLPFWRIQNVKIERPFYFRGSQYAVVILDTAGSAKEEAKIVAVTRDYAQTLKQRILSAGTVAPAQQDAASLTDDNTGVSPTNASASDTTQFDETVINKRSITDLVIHGLTNNRVWIILGAMAPFYDDVAGFVFDWIDSMGLSLDSVFQSEQIAWWQLSLYIVSMVLMVLGAMATISVAGSVITYYDYTLSRTADRYIRRSGLFSQQEVSMRQSRVQKVSIKQDWLDFLLKRANFFFEQNKTGNQQEQELHASHKMVVPSVTSVEAQRLADDVMPDNQLYPAVYTGISKRFVTRYITFMVVPVFVLVSVIGYQNEGWAVFGFSVPLAAVLAAGVYQRWRRWGFAIDQQYCYVRNGIIGIDRYCFPLHKVQQVSISQSVLMKRRGLANVHFVLASGSVSVPFMPYDMALVLANRAVWEVESQRKSWM